MLLALAVCKIWLSESMCVSDGKSGGISGCGLVECVYDNELAQSLAVFSEAWDAFGETHYVAQEYMCCERRDAICV